MALLYEVRGVRRIPYGALAKLADFLLSLSCLAVELCKAEPSAGPEVDPSRLDDAVGNIGRKSPSWT